MPRALIVAFPTTAQTGTVRNLLGDLGYDITHIVDAEVNESVLHADLLVLPEKCPLANKLEIQERLADKTITLPANLTESQQLLDAIKIALA